MIFRYTIQKLRTLQGSLKTLHATGRTGVASLAGERAKEIERAIEILKNPVVPIEFVLWYSGMKTEQVEAAYQRWLKEKSNSQPETRNPEPTIHVN